MGSGLGFVTLTLYSALEVRVGVRVGVSVRVRSPYLYFGVRG